MARPPSRQLSRKGALVGLLMGISPLLLVVGAAIYRGNPRVIAVLVGPYGLMSMLWLIVIFFSIYNIGEYLENRGFSFFKDDEPSDKAG